MTAKATITNTTKKKRMQTVVVVRHGERLDYVMKALGKNWITEDDKNRRPWDPPLTETGIDQAKQLGSVLFQRIVQDELNLPPIHAVYSSPFLRCRQTAASMIQGAMTGDTNDNENDRRPSSLGPSSTIKVQVELGLSESINENWYRSWAIPGTDGTWGYKKHETPQPDPESLHPASKVPIVDESHVVLDWKRCPLPNDDGQRLVDHSHTSQTRLIMKFGDDGDDHGSNVPLYPYYCFYPPQFESFKMQRRRMALAMNELSSRHIDETIVLVSHGGPVTHLFESVTGNHWDVHGQSKYCCFSIYQKDYSGIDDDDDDEDTNGNLEETVPTPRSNRWTPLIVNRSLWDDDDDDFEDTSTKRQKSFQWS